MPSLENYEDEWADDSEMVCARVTLPGIEVHTAEAKAKALERVWKGVYGAWAGCQGRRPGGGARRRAMRPIMAHLTMASEWVGRRS